jgi:hypothetical protein
VVLSDVAVDAVDVVTPVGPIAGSGADSELAYLMWIWCEQAVMSGGRDRPELVSESEKLLGASAMTRSEYPLVDDWAASLLLFRRLGQPIAEVLPGRHNVALFALLESAVDQWTLLSLFVHLHFSQILPGLAGQNQSGADNSF